MANAQPSLAQLSRQMSRICLYSRPSLRPQTSATAFQPVAFQARFASAKGKGASHKSDFKGGSRSGFKKKEVTKKKRKTRTTYLQYDMRDAEQYSLLDAMRYLRAAEVGRSPTAMKYEIALKLKSLKNGPVIRNRLRLPHPVKTDLRVCVICPPNSAYATAARSAGATLVGEDEVFEAVKAGRIEFDRCLCQFESLQKLNKSGIGRILGPRQLMPSAKTGTVIKDPAVSVREMVGAAEYRERLGVVRMAVGQLGFTPEEVQKNIKAFIEAVKKDMAQMSEAISKEIAEVVLSSTNGPGLSMNGNFKDADTPITSQQLGSP